MKLSFLYSSALLLSALSAASPIPSSDEASQLERRAQEWKLRALTPRGVTPVIDDYLEIIDGKFVVGANPDAPDFVGVCRITTFLLT